MKTKLLLCCLSSLLFFSTLHAQIKCGFDARMNEMRRQHPGYENEINNHVRKYIIENQLSIARLAKTQAAIYYIPVVVHVLHTGGAVGSTYNPTAANIAGAIDYLNAVYDGTWTGSGGAILGVGDIQIKFVLATKDPDNNASTGINRIDASSLANYTAGGMFLSSTGATELDVKNLSRWDPARYYNIWVVNKIDGLDGTAGSFVAGFAYFPMPNNTTTNNLRRDGTVMLATQMQPGRKTLPHEIGHAFNLHHPFQGETDVTGMNTCPVNGNPATDGDACADTDPTVNPADDGYGGSAFSCRTGTNSCNGAAYNDYTEKNFMNYTFCYQLFTPGQKTRMLAAASLSTRSGLTSSWANNQGTYPTTWVAPAAPAVTPVPALNFADYLGIMYVSLNGNKIYSLNTTQDGGYVNNVKWYNLFQVEANTGYTMELGLRNSGNAEQIGVWIDYDGNGSFNDVNERVFYSINNAATSTLSFNFTTPTALSGAIVRMRIMNDFSTIYGRTPLNGASATMDAGQAEDYPVFLRTSGVLPLTLLKFSGHSKNGNNYLSWTTNSETGTKEFVVQRSFNGGEYASVGTVDAQGNSNSEINYQFTDKEMSSGQYNYRLKMVDVNDAFTYSKSVSLTLDAPLKTTILTNPFTTTIKLLVPAQSGAVTVRLFDAVGKTLLQRNVNTAAGNFVELNIDPSTASGIYFLQTTVYNKSSVQKLVKQ
ncbi:MAG: zinc-dependent metalloprotease [Bacteroidota bacterium]